MWRYDPGRFLRILAAILLLNVAAFATATVLHELGHAAYGTAVGCQNVEIVLLDLEMGSTFTRMDCPPPHNMLLLAFSGSVFVLPFALLLLLLRGHVERYVGWIVLGSHVLASAADIGRILPGPVVFGMITAAGAVLVAYGEKILAAAIFREHTPSVYEAVMSQRAALEEEPAEEKTDKAPATGDAYDDDTA